MLSQLSLDNFKCFKSLVLPLKSLTILSGYNAAGKSTALQGLLLLTQALRTRSRLPMLALNGPLTSLGSPGDILNTGSNDIAFGIKHNKVGVKWKMQAGDRVNGLALEITEIIIINEFGEHEFDVNLIKRLENLLPAGLDVNITQVVENLNDIIYISALRSGVAHVFPSPENISPVNADVGTMGEFAPWWFWQHIDTDIDKERCHHSDEAMTLRRQYNAWANHFFPGAQGNAIPVDKTNLVRLEFKIGDIGDWRRPANIGYGLTYAFPIIVAGLLAQKGQILFVDSPEAHLHPLGQSQMGRFLAQVAASGVQVIIETHSDHVINGARVAVKEKLINRDNVNICWFNKCTDASEQYTKMTEINIDENGELSDYPKDFLDEWSNQLLKLV